jgi:hypothetical protein
VNLKNRLRDIETDRANLAHGRLPLKWFVSTQPPYGTLMPQSGRRPQHQIYTRILIKRLSAGREWSLPVPVTEDRRLP